MSGIVTVWTPGDCRMTTPAVVPVEEKKPVLLFSIAQNSQYEVPRTSLSLKEERRFASLASRGPEARVHDAFFLHVAFSSSALSSDFSTSEVEETLQSTEGEERTAFIRQLPLETLFLLFTQLSVPARRAFQEDPIVCMRVRDVYMKGWSTPPSWPQEEMKDDSWELLGEEMRTKAWGTVDVERALLSQVPRAVLDTIAGWTSRERAFYVAFCTVEQWKLIAAAGMHLSLTQKDRSYQRQWLHAFGYLAPTQRKEIAGDFVATLLLSLGVSNFRAVYAFCQERRKCKESSELFEAFLAGIPEEKRGTPKICFQRLLAAFQQNGSLCEWQRFFKQLWPHTRMDMYFQKAIFLPLGAVRELCASHNDPATATMREHLLFCVEAFLTQCEENKEKELAKTVLSSLCYQTHLTSFPDGKLHLETQLFPNTEDFISQILQGVHSKVKDFIVELDPTASSESILQGIEREEYEFVSKE